MRDSFADVTAKRFKTKEITIEHYFQGGKEGVLSSLIPGIIAFYIFHFTKK